MAVSIKLLNISLVLLCIVTTAFTCTYLAITSSNTALDDTKGSRDNSVSAAFTVGEESVKERTAEYIELLMGSTEEFLESFTKAHRLASMSIAKEIQAAPWDEVKYFTWHRLPRYFHHYNLLRPDGNTAVSVILTNSLMVRNYEDPATFTNPPDGYHSLLVELNYGSNDPLGGSQKSFVAQNDGNGYPFNVTNPLTDVNWNASSCRKSAVATNGSVPDEPCVDTQWPHPTWHYSLFFLRSLVGGGTMWTTPMGVYGGFVVISCATSIYHNGVMTGAVASEADVRHISKYLATLEIGGPVGGYPSRGRVFVTARTSTITNTQQGGILVAASNGTTVEPFVTTGFDGFVPIRTYQSDDPIISAIGGMVNETSDPSENDLAGAGNYTVLVLNTPLAPEGEEFYYRVVRLMDSYTLDWNVHVVIDRAYMLGKIDQQVNETREEISVSEKHVDDNLKSARTVLYIAVVAVAVGLIALSTVLVFRIIEPLVVLEREMAAVAVMRLEDVDTRRPLSSLKEVRLMQQSFVQMIWNLVEYRNYMPASVLQHDDSDTDSETPLCGEARKEGSRSSLTVSSHAEAAQVCGVHVLELYQKKVTLMVCNIVDFLMVRDTSRMQQLIATYLSTCLHRLRVSKGIPDTFSGDRLYASWNGVRPCTSHRFEAYHCAREMCGDKAIGARLSIGLVSGDVKCGNMGCDGMKRFSYIGSLSSWVHVVERIGRSMECEVAVDAVVNEEVHNRAYTRMLQHVVYPKKGDQVYRVHEALGMRERPGEDEWMYQLEERQARDPYKAYNRSYELFMDGKVGDALRELGDYDDGTAVAKNYRARLRDALGSVSKCVPLGKDAAMW